MKNSFALGLITPKPLMLQVVPRDWRLETRNAHGARFNADADADEGGNSSRDADFPGLIRQSLPIRRLLAIVQIADDPAGKAR